MATTRILKYNVNSGYPTKITCRRNRLLDIQLQGQSLVCWMETRDDLPETTTELVVIGTGWEVPSDVMRDTKYIKSVQDYFGFVWHFYEMLSGH